MTNLQPRRRAISDLYLNLRAFVIIIGIFLLFGLIAKCSTWVVGQ